jgi:hypothetical protein
MARTGARGGEGSVIWRCGPSADTHAVGEGGACNGSSRLGQSALLPDSAVNCLLTVGFLASDVTADGPFRLTVRAESAFPTVCMLIQV